MTCLTERTMRMQVRMSYKIKLTDERNAARDILAKGGEAAKES